jgi:hypothetical protein
MPVALLTDIQTKKINLQQQRSRIDGQLAEISAMETMCEQYTQRGATKDAGKPGTTITTAPRRRGRPATNQNAQQNPRAERAAKKTSGDRASSETVVLEALANFPHGATFAQVKTWVGERYGDRTYIPNIIRIALNRAWVSRKLGADRVIIKGSDPVYLPLSYQGSNMIMAEEKAAPKRTGTGG